MVVYNYQQNFFFFCQLGALQKNTLEVDWNMVILNVYYANIIVTTQCLNLHLIMHGISLCEFITLKSLR